MGENGHPDRKAWVLAALEAYEAPLMRYATRLTGDVQHAQDVVQDTFIRLCTQSPHELNGREREWLFATCRNRAIDIRRKHLRMKPMADVAEANPECAERGPATALEVSETAGRALRLMAELPENQQEVLRLKFQCGLSYREIAGVTGLSVGNVGFLIHTGLKRLRQRMKV